MPDVFCNSVDISFVVAAAKEGHFSDPASIIEHRAVKRAGFWMKTHPGSLVSGSSAFSKIEANYHPPFFDDW